MLRVRVVSPADLTGQLLEQLSTAPGVQNLVVLPAAAQRPEGDAVDFDLNEGAANPVFRELRNLGLVRQGSISVEPARSGARPPRCGRWWKPSSAAAQSTPRAFTLC